jgi:hypothetical protein
LTEPSEEGRVQQGLRKLLDRHGHGFHYATLRQAQKQRELGESPWNFEAAEFPVESRGTSTRIDFVLKHHRLPWYLVAECKRPNPALSRWAFVRAPYVRRNRAYEPYIAERLHISSGMPFATGVALQYSLPKAYHLGLELRSDETGDSGGAGKGAIEDAAGQVSRGVSGLSTFFAENAHLVGDASAFFFPVVFTSADLWTSELDLSAADPLSGMMSADLRATQVGWLPLQYHVSPALKHTHLLAGAHHSLGESMDAQYVRTIPIVSASAVPAFLRWWFDLESSL